MSATGERGFTLLEMLVVLAVAGLVAGIGFPRLQGQVAAQEWRTGVVAVTTLLRSARAQALRRGTVVTVVGDGRSLRTSAGAALALPESVSVSMPQPSAFFADGSASGGAVLVSGARGAAQITVAPATGLPSVRPA